MVSTVPRGEPSPSRFRRRRYLVDPAHQVRVGLAAVAITLVLLVLLDASLFLGRNEGAARSGGGDFLDTGLIAAGSLVFLAGVFGVSILETHRTAGAAKSLVDTLERFRDGDWGARARLRRGDNLKDLAASFNALAGDLHERRTEETDRLQKLAESAERDPQGTARALRAWAEERRREAGRAG